MSRLFIYDGRTFPDPDSRLTVDEVRRQLSDFFPELANADTREERRGEDTACTFARRIGTKGGGRRRRWPPDIVGILRRVAPHELRDSLLETGFVGIARFDVPLLLLGSGAIGARLMRGLFRVLPLERLSASANAVAFVPK